MKTVYKIEISPKKFWLLLLPLSFVFVALLGFGSYLMIDRVVMPKVTGMSNKGEVTIPLVINKSLKEAKKAAYDRGLRISSGESEYSDTAPVGQILSQEPEEGDVVKKGRHIFVITSKGSEVDTVPSVSGMPEGPAKSTLRKAGFRNISVKNLYSNSIEQNVSISTEPGKNTITSREAKIILWLSKGKRPTHSVVPNMVGDMLSQARSAISDAGLRMGTISYETSSVMGAGQVISQSASSGARIALESRVNLVVAKK